MTLLLLRICENKDERKKRAINGSFWD